MSDLRKPTDEEAAHDDAADVHDRARKRHGRAAGHWASKDDGPKSDLEMRDSAVDNDAAEVDRDRARLVRKRREDV